MPAPQTVFPKVWSFIRRLPAMLVRSRITLIVVVLVVLVAGFFAWRHLSAGKKSGGYLTAQAAFGNIQETVSASGNIIADQSVALTFKNQGYVKTCSVQLGDFVKAGQVLATEDPADLQNALDQAEASLSGAQASYNKLASTESQEITQAQAATSQAQTALNNAKSTLDRDQQLLGAGAVSQSTVDSDNNAYQQAMAQYQSAQYTLAQDETHADVVAAAAQVKSAQAQVKQAQENLADASIVAPFDGYVSTIDGNPGMWTGGGAVASGTSTATQFEIILTSTQMEIDGYINEADISKVKAGQPVTFTVDTYPGQTFTGKIASLSPNATTVSSVQEYETHISIDDYSKLKGGLPATISVVTASANNVILVPQSALTYSRTYLATLAGSGKGVRFQTGSGQAANRGSATSQGKHIIINSQGGQTPSPGNSQTGASAPQSGASSSQNVGLVVVLVDGKPQVRMVTTGLSDDVNVEITSGLKAGDIVVTGSSIPAKTSGSTSNSGQESNTMSPAERATLGLPGGGG